MSSLFRCILTTHRQFPQQYAKPWFLSSCYGILLRAKWIDLPGFAVTTLEKNYNHQMKSNAHLIIYGDGGSRGNPGEAAYGFAVFDQDEKLIYAEGKRLGVTTNNVAEYSAVTNAFRWVIANCPDVLTITFRLDSLLIASQMAGKFKVKHPNMRELFISAKRLEGQLSAQIIYTQIPREKNTVADKLVNDALDFKI